MYCQQCGSVLEQNARFCQSCGNSQPPSATLVVPQTHTRVVVRTYKGSQAGATARYQSDAARLAAQGYFPISQSWAPGAYGCAAFLFALLLCFIFVGILVFIYMLIVKPDGTLSVTYEWRG